MRNLKILIVTLLIFISIEGLTGNYVNLFSAFPSGSVALSFSGLINALQGAGLLTVFHASLGVLILATSVIVLILSLRTKMKSISIFSILGLFAVASAVAGGLLFVFSGFSNNGDSAQMGGSFIGAYTFYFIELYFTHENPKKTDSLNVDKQKNAGLLKKNFLSLTRKRTGKLLDNY